MITTQRRAEHEDLLSYGLPLCAIPSTRHELLLATYRMNLKRGSKAVREMIAGDVERCLELGAWQRAADLLLVLRLFVSSRERGGRAA